MAVEQHVFEWLKEFAPCKLLSLGYPDLLIHEPGPQRFDSREVARWHHWNHPVPDTEAVFKALGIEATYIDIHPSRGVERVVDLNYPTDLEGFDLVLDPGTIEHCFNIGQAFQNIAAAVKVGGHVIHTNPMTRANHGFWSISPTAYMDWYETNGFEVVAMGGIGGRLDDRIVVEVEPNERFTAPPEFDILVVAKKLRDMNAVWPTQWKYRQNPDLKRV